MTEQKTNFKRRLIVKEPWFLTFSTNSPRGNEKANRKFSFVFRGRQAKQEVFQQTLLPTQLGLIKISLSRKVARPSVVELKGF